MTQQGLFVDPQNRQKHLREKQRKSCQRLLDTNNEEIVSEIVKSGRSYEEIMNFLNIGEVEEKKQRNKREMFHSHGGDRDLGGKNLEVHKEDKKQKRFPKVQEKI